MPLGGTVLERLPGHTLNLSALSLVNGHEGRYRFITRQKRSLISWERPTGHRDLHGRRLRVRLDTFHDCARLWVAE